MLPSKIEKDKLHRELRDIHKSHSIKNSAILIFRAILIFIFIVLIFSGVIRIINLAIFVLAGLIAGISVYFQPNKVKMITANQMDRFILGERFEKQSKKEYEPLSCLLYTSPSPRD